MAKGRQPIIKPAFEKAYGPSWAETVLKDYAGLTIEQAQAKFQKDTSIQISPAGLLHFFNKELQGFSCNKPAGTKKRGKPSKTVPLLLTHFKTEEALKEALQNLTGNTIKHIAEVINEQAGTNIEPYNLYNLIKGFGIDLSCKRGRKPKLQVSEEFPEGKEVDLNPEKTIQHEFSKSELTPVKFVCQTPKCTGTVSQMSDLRIGLALRARRCPCCNKFGTYQAQYKHSLGHIVSISLQEIDGSLCEVQSETISALKPVSTVFEQWGNETEIPSEIVE